MEQFLSSGASTQGTSGKVSLSTVDGGVSGDMEMITGSTTGGTSGSISMTSGKSTGGKGGTITLSVGDGDTGVGGDIQYKSWYFIVIHGTGGAIQIETGQSTYLVVISMSTSNVWIIRWDKW